MGLSLASLSPTSRERRVREAREDMWTAASALCGIREDVEHRLRELQRMEALQVRRRRRSYRGEHSFCFAV